MQKFLLSNIGLAILISAFLLFAGDSFVLQRTLVNTTEYLTIRGDTNSYVSMIEGNWIAVSSPFKFRILVPFIASLLPFSPTDSLKFISYLSLFFSYLLILLTCRRLGLNISSSVIGLLSVWASTWHLYNYHNPFLTDAFGLLMLCVMLFALLNNDFLVFLIAALLGVLAREPTIFLVPIWAVKKEWRRSISLIAISVIVLLIPRLFLASEADPTLVSVFVNIGQLEHPLMFGKAVFLSWGFVWFISLIGVWYLPDDKFAPIAAAYMSLFLGATFTSLIATDTGRMFSILTPIIVTTSAQFYSNLVNNKKRFMALAFVGLIILQAFVSLPNVIFGEGSWVFGLARIILLCGEISFIAFVLITYRKSLQREVPGKAMHLLKTIPKPFSHTE